MVTSTEVDASVCENFNIKIQLYAPIHVHVMCTCDHTCDHICGAHVHVTMHVITHI